MAFLANQKQELEDHPQALAFVADEKRDILQALEQDFSDDSISEVEQIHHKPPPRQFALIMIGLSSCVFLSSLDQIIVATSIPAISRDFSSLHDISWLGTAYLMTSTSCQPLYGKFSDIFGRKALILFANFIFLVGSIISGWSTSMTMLIAGRGVAGIGAGGLIAMVFIIISDMLDMRERSKYIGAISAVNALSSVAGPLLGGVFSDNITWRWSFWINMPIVAISTFFISANLNLPASKGSFKDKIRRMDLLGAPLLMIAVTLILLPLSWGGNKYEWSDGVIIGLLCAGFAVSGIFLLVEWKVPKEPIVPLHLFKIRNLWVTYTSVFFSGMSYFGILFYAPIYFQVVKKESATIGGLEIVPFIFGIVFSSIFSGVWANKKGTFLFFLPLGYFIFAIGSAICLLFKSGSPHFVPVVAFIVCGIGMGFTMQTSMLAVQAAAEPKYMATVTALAQFMRSLGQVFGIAILGTVFNNKLKDSLEHDFPGDTNVMRVTQNYSYTFHFTPDKIVVIYESFVTALHYAFYCCVIFCLISLISSFFLHHKKLENSPSRARPEAAVEIP
ncbi:hypothetical protein BGX27_005032 [Mortierella sp. AM989]|nr:hypothetical protein BGX27_005032 [Mortierella sp. AM989]